MSSGADFQLRQSQGPPACSHIYPGVVHGYTPNSWLTLLGEKETSQ